MRIVSFNIYRNNKKLPQLLEFLKQGHFDIICLQEFPVSALDQLEQFRGWHTHLAEEFYAHKRKPDKNTDLRLVILSRRAPEGTAAIKHLERKHTSLRYKLSHKEVRVAFHYVDVTDEKGNALRVFNCHLEFTANPLERLAQFRDILAHRDPARQNIICGDMNTFGIPFVNMFMFWILGYKMRHIFLNEPRMFGEVFREFELQNPFSKQRTYPRVPAQLDYILLPAALEVKEKKIFKERYGSDHRAIMVEI